MISTPNLRFFTDCRLNWQAHLRHRVALGHNYLRTISRAMPANSIPTKLARKVAWTVAMSTAAYGIGSIWEDQKWPLDGPGRLTTALGRAVAGTLSTAKRGCCSVYDLLMESLLSRLVTMTALYSATFSSCLLSYHRIRYTLILSTKSSSNSGDAVHATDIPPAQPALDRRR